MKEIHGGFENARSRGPIKYVLFLAGIFQAAMVLPMRPAKDAVGHDLGLQRGRVQRLCEL